MHREHCTIFLDSFTDFEKEAPTLIVSCRSVLSFVSPGGVCAAVRGASRHARGSVKSIFWPEEVFLASLFERYENEQR
jgi:hypothetical protein